MIRYKPLNTKDRLLIILLTFIFSFILCLYFLKEMRLIAGIGVKFIRNIIRFSIDLF